MVVCTEVIEHIYDWRKAISHMKNVLKPEGLLLLTTRSIGFGYHGYPNDFWRFELKDLAFIFSDFNVEVIEKDPSAPGVFMKARKPNTFNERQFDNYPLFSIVTLKKCNKINKYEILLRLVVKKTIPKQLKLHIKKKIYQKHSKPTVKECMDVKTDENG
jgi:SAM-dependent methyltransferase